MIKRKVPFAFWEFRGLEPLVNAVGREILVGRFLRLLSSGGGYGSSKQLKDNCRRKFKFMLLCLSKDSGPDCSPIAQAACFPDPAP